MKAKRVGISKVRTHMYAFETQAPEPLRVEIDNLPVDGALFVVWGEGMDAAYPPEDSARRLRRLLMSRQLDRGVVLLADADKGGVWVYRPAPGGPGGGKAIGAAREADVRSREVSD